MDMLFLCSSNIARLGVFVALALCVLKIFPDTNSQLPICPMGPSGQMGNCELVSGNILRTHRARATKTPRRAILLEQRNNMSIYFVTDTTDEPGDLASNQGWSDFGAWADGLDSDQFPAIVHLNEHGWYEPVGDLVKELPGAIKAHPPTATGLDSTLQGMM